MNRLTLVRMIAVTKYRSSHGQLVWMACMKGSSKNSVTSSSLFGDNQIPQHSKKGDIRRRQKETQERQPSSTRKTKSGEKAIPTTGVHIQK